MTVERAVRILNAEAGWEKWSPAEAAALLDGLRVVRNAARSAARSVQHTGTLASTAARSENARARLIAEDAPCA